MNEKNSNPKPNDIPAKNFRIIKVGKTFAAIVDPDDYEWLSKFHWSAKRIHGLVYAIRREWRGKTLVEIRMHREIMHAPKHLQVHHLNRRPLDNRKINLKLVDREAHKKTHNISS